MLIYLEAVVAESMHTVSLLVSIFAGDGGGRGGIRGGGGGGGGGRPRSCGRSDEIRDPMPWACAR